MRTYNEKQDGKKEHSGHVLYRWKGKMTYAVDKIHG